MATTRYFTEDHNEVSDAFFDFLKDDPTGKSGQEQFEKMIKALVESGQFINVEYETFPEIVAKFRKEIAPEKLTKEMFRIKFGHRLEYWSQMY